MSSKYIKYRNNGIRYSIERIAEKIMAEQIIDEIYTFERWLRKFLKIKSFPKRKTYQWRLFIDFRKELRFQLDNYFYKNKKPYWIQIVNGIGFVLRNGEYIDKILFNERRPRIQKPTTLASKIVDGLSKAKSLDPETARNLKKMKEEFFDPITDMCLGRAMRQKFPEAKIKRMLSSKKTKKTKTKKTKKKK